MEAALSTRLGIQRRNESGFSLIELMVVVAIIGVLATIAIPRVNQFIAKARTSEAQVNLSSIYTFNKNFYIEFQGYTPYFDVMGYAPEGRLRYNMGWDSAKNNCPAAYTTVKGVCSAVGTGKVNVLDKCGVSTAGAIVGCALVPGPGDTTGVAIVAASCAASDAAFTAVAIANLVSGVVNDGWTINQDKSLMNTQDGTK